MDSSVFISKDRSVVTCCFMSMLSSSRRLEVMKSEVGQASSSDIVRTNVSPSVEVSELCSSYGEGERGQIWRKKEWEERWRNGEREMEEWRERWRNGGRDGGLEGEMEEWRERWRNGVRDGG
jgi:hypothetical protein